MSGDVGAEVAAVLDEHFWHPPVPNKKHPMGNGGCYCGWQAPFVPYTSTLDQYRQHLADALAPLIAARVEAAKAEALREAIEAHSEHFGPLGSLSRQWLRNRADALDIWNAATGGDQ